MRTFKVNSVLLLFSLAAVSSWGLLVGVTPASGGEPIVVGGQPFGSITPNPGEPFLWDTSSPIPYRTDGGALGTLSNGLANGRVATMFRVWQDVPTAAIGFTRQGQILGVVDGDVNSASEFDAVVATCDDPRQPNPVPNAQSPVVYDQDGSLFSALGLGSNVIGFAGPCAIDVVGGQNRLDGGIAVMNGRFLLEGILNDVEFDQAFTHEFGHFAGLGHSQINVDVLTGNFSQDNMFGLPLMFPFLIGTARLDQNPPFPPLAPDDEAWISFLYPRQPDFDSQFGRITGEVLFSDGITPVLGANVIARERDDLGTVEREDRRNAVSVVSGYRFTGNPGQSVTAGNPGSPFGSRDPMLIGFYEIPIRPGDYTVEVESINPQFTEGSSVGPLGADLGEQFSLPGPPEFWNLAESPTDDPSAKDAFSVPAGQVLPEPKNIILNGTPTRFDTHEGEARLRWRETLPAWRRGELWFGSGIGG